MEITSQKITQFSFQCIYPQKKVIFKTAMEFLEKGHIFPRNLNQTEIRIKRKIFEIYIKIF